MKASVRAQEKFQGLGRALMLPIAVLPIAALLLRLGQPDLLNLPFVAAAGSAIFTNLGLLFAIGVGLGLAKENNGAAGLAGAVAYLVLTNGAQALLVVPESAIAIEDSTIRATLVEAWRQKQLAKLAIPAGIISGIAAGYIYNRFHTIALPSYLSFFGGRRFVPIAAGLFGLVAAAIFGLGFPVLELAIDRLSYWVIEAGSLGLFVYGVLNRLLLITGLHHILNNLAWFVIGDFEGSTGDLSRFFAGDPDAGAFMAGFFPVMMFGLPAACLAMWRSLPVERQKPMAGMYVSMALTSMLTGVTEPIEFSFMFLAPVLFAVHAVMTGLSMVVMDWLEIRLGFGFSAGLFDYVLNFNLATRPLYLIPIGLAYFVCYYVVFGFFIRLLKLKVPGFEAGAAVAEEDAGGSVGALSDQSRIAQYVRALGGPQNIEAIDACTTRLRLVLHDTLVVDDGMLRTLGAKGVLNVGSRGVQVVIGPEADRIAGGMRGYCEIASRDPATDSENRVDAPLAQQAVIQDSHDQNCDGFDLNLVGGAANVVSQNSCGRRMILRLRDPLLIAHDQLDEVHKGRWVQTTPCDLHILI